MPSLNANLMWCVHRIRTTFCDALGNRRTGVGTGFWLYVGEHDVFVTNRHNVDPSLKFPDQEDLELLSVELDLRQWVRGATPDTQFFPVETPLRGLHVSPAADCAILVDPVLTGRDAAVFPSSRIIRPKDLAPLQSFTAGVVQPMDPAVFIGFPGSAGQHWWDDRWNMPVARQCVLASVTSIPFTNRDIRTTDTILVSGLSFAGASGSPVFLPPRGLAPGGDINDPDWRPAFLIGLMSGHFWEPGATPEMFRHSGLSYLTRSTTIWDLLIGTGLAEDGAARI